MQPDLRSDVLNKDKVNQQIQRHMKVRDGKDLSSAINPVKERILTARAVQQLEEAADFVRTDWRGLKPAARCLAEAMLAGGRVCILGRTNPDHLLAIAALSNGLRLLCRSLQRTRDVVQTSRGSFSGHINQFDVNYICFNFTPARYGDECTLDRELAEISPDVVVLLDPSFGVINRINQQLPSATTIAVATHDRLEHLSDSDVPVIPFPEEPGASYAKGYTVCALAHELTCLTRDMLVELISSHPRSQALISQLRTAGLEASCTLVALSYLCDDMPMKSHIRNVVAAGVDRINRGWTQQPRTSHSRGNLHYGLRALLVESEAVYPFTAQQLQMRLIPMFSSVCYAGFPETIIECLRCNELKTSKDKAYRASLLKAKTYFPSLKQLAGLIGAEPLAEKHEVNPAIGDYEESIFENDERLLPIYAERRYAETGKTQLVVASIDDDKIRCFLRSDYINVNDALCSISFEMEPDQSFQFWADAFAGDLVVDSEAYSQLKIKLNGYHAHNAQTEVPLCPLIIDGDLTPNQRTASLAQWLEKQPWGRHYPEPVFEQYFMVRSSTILMESHCKLVVVDFNCSESDGGGEGFELLWRHSVAALSERLRQNEKVLVRYRLRSKRDASCGEVFGEVISLELA